MFKNFTTSYQTTQSYLLIDKLKSYILKRSFLLLKAIKCSAWGAPKSKFII